METVHKSARYQRLFEQLSVVLHKPSPLMSRLASVVALLHHKMPGFFWTGFYLLHHEDLFVGPYQGPLACQKLERGKGVCWTGILEGKTIIVPDVHKFPGHIACDSRSLSEIVVPLRNAEGVIIGVLDVDSTRYAAFDEADAQGLEMILSLLNQNITE